MSHSREILVLTADIDMMRAVLTRAGFDKRACLDDEVALRAAQVVMASFRKGMCDPDELHGELLFRLGKPDRSRVDMPRSLPKYAIQGLPTERCCPASRVDIGHLDNKRGETEH